jgi:hypothetical protein
MSNTPLVMIALLLAWLFATASAVLLFAYLKQRRTARVTQETLLGTIRRLQSLNRDLQGDALEALRREWFREIADLAYRNETEVEVKLIYPLLRFLGYGAGDFQVRVPVTVQVGRQQITGEADWVVWNKPAGSGARRPHLIIEAKGPQEQLTDEAQAQARSYAFGLNAPLYLLTNGRRIQLFRREAQFDTCLLESELDALASSWKVLAQAIGGWPEEADNP